MVAATIKNASFKQNENNLELTFASKWNASKMEETHFQMPLLETLSKLFGGDWTIQISHNPSPNHSFDDVF